MLFYLEFQTCFLTRKGFKSCPSVKRLSVSEVRSLPHPCAAGYRKQSKISAVVICALCAYTVFAVYIYSPTVQQQLEKSQVSFSCSPKCSIGERRFFLVKIKSRNKKDFVRCIGQTQICVDSVLIFYS